MSYFGSQCELATLSHSQYSDQTHPAPNPQFTLCNPLTAIPMATCCWHSNLPPTSYSYVDTSLMDLIQENMCDQQNLLTDIDETLMKSVSGSGVCYCENTMYCSGWFRREEEGNSVIQRQD